MPSPGPTSTARAGYSTRRWVIATRYGAIPAIRSMSWAACVICSSMPHGVKAPDVRHGQMSGGSSRWRVLHALAATLTEVKCLPFAASAKPQAALHHPLQFRLTFCKNLSTRLVPDGDRQPRRNRSSGRHISRFSRTLQSGLARRLLLLTVSHRSRSSIAWNEPTPGPPRTALPHDVAARHGQGDKSHDEDIWRWCAPRR